MRSLRYGILALLGSATLITTAATAASVTYDVNLTFHNSPGSASINPLASATLSGSIVTDGATGPLSLSDITGQHLTLTTGVGSSPVAFDEIDGSTNTDGLMASSTALSFLFGGGAAYADVSGNFLAGSISFYAAPDAADGFATPYIAFFGPSAPNDLFAPNGTQFQPLGSSLVIGTAEGGGSIVSAVPLPASAPLFGAALIALGVVGYGVKRTGKAAAAT